MTEAAFTVGVAAGAFVGFWIGRGWAEMNRARHDMRRTWRGRSGYRD